jgi:hypothetical protein
VLITSSHTLMPGTIHHMGGSKQGWGKLELWSERSLSTYWFCSSLAVWLSQGLLGAQIPYM